jgi:hypothetical protein
LAIHRGGLIHKQAAKQLFFLNLEGFAINGGFKRASRNISLIKGSTGKQNTQK